MKPFRIDERYIRINLSRAIIASVFLVAYCAYLSIDNFMHDTPTVGWVALVCGVMTAVAGVIFYYCKRTKQENGIWMHIGILIQCVAYWGVYAFFLYTGGTGGTSIFLIFNAAPATLFFYNLVYGSGFCFVVVLGMAIYMNSPLRLTGYQFPEMYYRRLPALYLIEVITCAVAQYVAVRAEIKQELATEEAERANEAKSEFLASTSHEIRTPINAVLGMNEMIIRESARAEKISGEDTAALQKSIRMIRNYAGNVESAGNNLLSIINDILDFSRIEEGRMDLVEVEYQLSSVLNDISNTVYFKTKEKDLLFETDVDETLPDRLYGDEVRVRQVITNVLNNAVKYTETGSVTLTVGRDQTPPPGEPYITLVITVKDTGIGIREADMAKLFEKFERVDLEKNSTIEGTGLGLAITKRLLDMMHGDVTVASEYGKGSTFTIILPQRVVAEEEIGDFKIKFERGLGTRKAYRELFRAPEAKVLAVDDTPMNLVVVEELLQQTQVQLDTAASGMEALEKTKKSAYDLILMDHRMPQMNGTQTLQNIRAQENGCNRDTVVICLTADAVQGARERYLADGFTDYLSKPIEIISLEATLMKYLPPEKVIRITEEVAEDVAQAPETEAAKPEPVNVPVGEQEPEQEVLSREEALRFTEEKTPELLASLRALMESLKPYFEEETVADKDADLPLLSQEGLDEVYKGVLEFTETFDQDGIKRLLAQTDGYAVPEGERERLERIKQCTKDSDWCGLKEALDALRI